jgi:putative endonuclease
VGIWLLCAVPSASSGSTSSRRSLGNAGESRAAAWYVAHGYEILDRNWRCPSGEIDLVCRRVDVVVICEVKTRRSAAFGDPLEAVTAAKRRRLRRLGTEWLRTHEVPCRQIRFDVVGILADVVEVVEGAF